MSRLTENTASFHLESWHLLTEVPVSLQTSTVQEAKPTAAEPATSSAKMKHDLHPALVGLNPDLMKLLYDILAYPYAGVRARIMRLNMSARAFEKAKLEGCEKGLVIESAAGATTYLIPLPKTFEAFNFACPYERASSIEHAFYVGWAQHLLQGDPANKRVHAELKVGQSSCTSDLVTVGHDGTRRAYEVTLSTGNCLSNAAKYAHTDFAQIVFLCRDYRLRVAVEACCREGGLEPDLVAKLEYMQFSALVSRQRKSSL
jgi:hypothetical protein